MIGKVQLGEIYYTEGSYLLVFLDDKSAEKRNIIISSNGEFRCINGGTTGGHLEEWLSRCEKLPFTINDLLEAGLEAMKETENE